MQKGGRNKTFSIFDDELTNQKNRLKSNKGQNHSLIQQNKGRLFSMRSGSEKNEERKMEAAGSLKRHQSFKRHSRRQSIDLKSLGHNTSPVDGRLNLTDLDIPNNSSFTLKKRRTNSSLKNLKLLKSDSESKAVPILPDVKKNHRHLTTKSPPVWDNNSKTPSAQNMPIRAYQSIFSQPSPPHEMVKTSEHLLMMRKLEEYKLFLQNLNIKDRSPPSDLEYTHQLDSFIDSINTVLTHRHLEEIKTESLNLATGLRTDFCQYILEKVRALRYKSTKFDEMFESLKSLADKYIVLEAQYEEKRGEMQGYKKETEELCMINYDLKKK